MISGVTVFSVLLLAIFAVAFDQREEFRRVVLMKAGGLLVMLALILGIVDDFIPHGLTALVSGTAMFAIGYFTARKKLHIS